MYGHGKTEEECGGGGTGPAWRAQGRQGKGADVDGEAAPGKRAKSSGGPVVPGAEKRQKKLLIMRERSRTLRL